MTQRPTLFTLFALLLAGLAFAAPAHAERIKDMGQFQGLRANQLTGYGLVVGLAGTGDDSLDYSTLGMKGAAACAAGCSKDRTSMSSRNLST